MPTHELLPVEHIQSRILVLRGQRVLLDADLAHLYGVPTKRLNEQVKRNPRKFPEDFMFRLTRGEAEAAHRSKSRVATPFGNRSQNAAGSQKHRDPRFLPYAFTEHGAIQAANVLNSETAVEMSVYVVRAFIRIRQFLGTHHELAQKLAELEQRIGIHDEAIRKLMTAIRQLMEPPYPKRRRIGFHARDARGKYRENRRRFSF